MMMTTAWIGSTLKINESAKAVKGMMPNWHRKPMKMPQGLRMCNQSFLASTVQPIENMTKASMMVSVVLITTLRMSLNGSWGTRQDVPVQMVAFMGQVGSGAHMLTKVSLNEVVKKKVGSCGADGVDSNPDVAEMMLI